MSWPHAPAHWLFKPGHYMLTGGTYTKKPFFSSRSDKDFLIDLLFSLMHTFTFELKAWSLFSNHYHLLIHTHEPKLIPVFIKHFHSISSHYINKKDGIRGRKIWFQYWDSHITFERSYLARIKYINRNPEHHGLTQHAEDYPWCSALWFRLNTRSSFYHTVESFKIDRIRVYDDF